MTVITAIAAAAWAGTGAVWATSSTELQREAAEAWHAAKDYAHDRKEQYARRAETLIESMERRGREIKSEVVSGAAAAKRESKAVLETMVEDIDDKADVARRRLGDVRLAAADRWEEAKEQVASEVDDLAGALERAADAMR